MGVSNIFKKLLLTRALHFEEGKVEILGLKGIIIPISAFCDFQKKLSENIGEKKTFESIKEIGKSQGKLAVNSGITKFGKLSEKFLELEIGLAEMLGLGKFEIVNIDLKDAKSVIHVQSNFAKEYLQKFGKSKQPIDYFLTGLIEGFSENFIKKPVICKETICIGMGNSYCEFIVKSKQSSN